jgi:hypothetical protein
MQVNNAGVGGVAVDQDGLRALNIDPRVWVCRFMLAFYFLWIDNTYCFGQSYFQTLKTLTINNI